MPIASGKYSISWNDRNAENGTTTVYTDEQTTLNETALTGQRNDFFNAWDAVTRGYNHKQEFGNVVKYDSPAIPSNDAQAHIELKWLVRFTDTTNFKRSNFSVPCLDDSYLKPNEDVMDSANQEYADVVNATEALVRSIDGNAIRVDEIVLTS